MSKGLVSVVIGVYNAERYLAEAIESVLGQDYRPIELVVVDDGSTDRSGAVAQRYSEVLYLQQRNGGNGAARNTGIGVATGDYLAFLDADDRFTPGKLTRQMDALEQDPELDLVFGHVQEFVSPEIDDETRGRIRAPAPEPMPWTAPNLMLIRRAAFDRVGLFETSVRVGVTVDWFLRAKEAGLRYTVLSETVLERRLHTENNGIREAASRSQYLAVLKASLDRRRAAAAEEQGGG